MDSTVLHDARPGSDEAAPGLRGRSLLIALVAVIAVAALVAAATAGWLVRGGGSGAAGAITASSVDAGFARDMSTHHVQAVTMAGYERDNTTNASLKLLSTDIETSQQFQLGLMPGMATPAQMSRLIALHGKALDVLFLQLMIHHHQGGLPMAQYAATHAKEPYVRTMAQAMITLQSNEIVEMEQLLRQLGGTPLLPPAG